MKVRVVANELVDTDIEMVSLVRHGANRCPFKILKSEDADKAKLGDRLQSFFSLGKDEFTVTAYYVRKDAAEALLPILKAEGVDISKAEDADGVLALPQSDLPARGFIQLNDALAISVDQPVREFSDESVVKAYAEGVGLSGFAPGVALTVRSLADGVWSLLNSKQAEGSREERVAKVDSMLASFRKYITALSKALPEQVFKVEAATRGALNEESDMPKGKLSEAMAGDLDGLEKSEAAPVIETPAKLDAPPVEAAPVAKGEDPVTAEAAPVEATPDPASAILKALEAISSKVDSLAKAVDEQRTVTDSLTAHITEVEGLAKSARTVAESTTVVSKGEDIDLALSSLGGRGSTREVRKSGDEVWAGLFSDLDSFRPSR